VTDGGLPALDLFDQLPVGGFQLDLQLSRARINRRLADYLGIPPGELSMEQMRQLPARKELGEQWLAAARSVLKDGGNAMINFNLEHRGSLHKISMRLGPLRDGGGRMIGLIGVTVDISDAQQIEKALQDAESRFQAFMDHLPVCAWVKNEEGRHEFLNRVYAEKFGIREWLGKRDEDLWPQELAQRFRESDLQVGRTGQSMVYEQTVARPGAEEGYWLVHKFPFRDGAGRRLTGGVALDITERRHLEERLRQSEARFQAFLDHSPALAWIKDEQGHYLFMSRSYAQFLNLGEEGWRGLTDADLYPADFAQRCMEQDQEVLALGRSREYVGPAPDVAGARREWLLVRFPFTDGSGRRFVGGVASDITERRRAEEHMRLQSLTDDLTGLYNRRGFWLLADQEYRLACRRRLRCALLLLDLDGLKQLNDVHGHEAGDEALVVFAEALRVATRNSDIIGRIGGDEFLVFAVDCEDVAALHARLLEAIRATNDHAGLRGSISASIGVVDFVASKTVPFDQLVAEADARMYATKRRRSA
jgi:diguanylate cyclase (GGDEF)-like protein/PAS domain S-box-containing protein